MRLCNQSIEEFAERVMTRENQVIFFGVGTLLQTWMPWVFQRHHILDSAFCCIDNDPAKWNTQIVWGKRSLSIYSPESLEHMDLQHCVILITSSYFSSMIDQLDHMPIVQDIECYIAPVMYITHPAESTVWQPRMRVKPSIPNVIHYCWFGGKPLPQHAQICIDSWREHCPGYEIQEWNEHNYDVGQDAYMKEAYESGQYGYVPDYARIDLLYRYGGFYFDVDVRLLRGLDDLRGVSGFTSFEEYPTLNFGGGSGAQAGLPILKDILDFRRAFHFLDAKGHPNRTSCGYYESIPLLGHGLRLDGTLQKIKDLTIFPAEYFHPKSTVTGRVHCTEQTRGIHDFGWSWATDTRLEETQATHRRYQEILERMEEG